MSLREPVVNGSGLTRRRLSIGVIIPVFNQARFLAEAIESVLAQTTPAEEIIVVDDGSADDPARVVANFPKVKFSRQSNRGPSAARNSGLQLCTTTHVVFLDADDRLLPAGLEAGLSNICDKPEHAFVYGGFRPISENGAPSGRDHNKPIEGDPFHALLHTNLIVIPSSIMFARTSLNGVNGFDESLRRCEDYDLVLRLARKYPIANHRVTVAEYRRHGNNVSENHLEMLKAELLVRDRYEAQLDAANHSTIAHIRSGRRKMIHFRVSAMQRQALLRWPTHRDPRALVGDLIDAGRWAPLFAVRSLLATLGRRAKKLLSLSAKRRSNRSTGREQGGVDTRP